MIGVVSARDVAHVIEHIARENLSKGHTGVYDLDNGQNGIGGVEVAAAAKAALGTKLVLSPRIPWFFNAPSAMSFALAVLNGVPDPDLIRSGAALFIPTNGVQSADWEPFVPLVGVERQLEPCSVEHWPRPIIEVSQNDTWDRSACTSRNDGLTVCELLGEHSFVLRRDGNELFRWGAHTFMSDGTTFEVLDGDLDADGDEEVIVAVRASASNGIPILTWNLAVFETVGVQPLNLIIQDYGDGTFVTVPNQPACHLLATEWDWMRDQVRGVGNYLVGRELDYRDGALIPLPNVRVRRLLDSFERTFVNREDGLWVNGPAADLSHPNTVWWPRDPIAEGPLDTDLPGVIEAIELLPHHHLMWVVRFTLAMDGGARIHVETGLPWEQRNETDVPVVRLGDLVSGVGLPTGYVPVDAENHWLGRRVQLSTYLGRHSDRSSVLWINGESE